MKGGAEEGRQEDRKVIEQKVLACVGELEHELTALFLEKKKAPSTTVCVFMAASRVCFGVFVSKLKQILFPVTKMKNIFNSKCQTTPPKKTLNSTLYHCLNNDNTNLFMQAFGNLTL